MAETQAPVPGETESITVRQRRRLLFAAVSGAALVAGAGVAWWQAMDAGRDPTVTGSGQPGGGLPDDVWAMEFDTPQGGRLSLASLKGRPLLINFWATWCPPCVEELPLLDRFFRDQASNGWQVIGLAVDTPSAVRTFLGQRPVTFPIGLAGLGGTELSRTLGNPKGALPFSVVLARDGAVAVRKLGQVHEVDLASWIKQI